MSKPDGMSHGMSDFSFFPNGRQQQSPTMAVPSGFMPNSGKAACMPDGNTFRDQQQREVGLQMQQSANPHVYQGLRSFSAQEDVHLGPIQQLKISQDPRLMPRNCMPSYMQYSVNSRPHQNSQMGLMQPQMQPSQMQNYTGRSLDEGQASRMQTPVHHNDINPLQFNQYHTPTMGNQNGQVSNSSNHSPMVAGSSSWGAQQNMQYSARSFSGRNGMALGHTPIGTAGFNLNPTEPQMGKSGAMVLPLPSTPVLHHPSLDSMSIPGLKRRSTQPSNNKASKKRRGLSSQILASPILPDSQQAQNEKAKAMYADLQSRVGPILTTKAHLCSDTVRQTCMSLLSGVPAAVNMTLNSLSLLSFHGFPLPPADQTKLVAALCRVIDRSFARRPPPMLLEAQKSPQLEKRFWWEEEEEGLIANLDHPPETVMWGICASNVLRNMVVSGRQGELGNFSMVGPRVLKCLIKRDGSFGFNEMALNMLETVQGMEGKADPVGVKGDCTLLVDALVKHMRDNQTPLRLRTASAGAFASIAGIMSHKEQVLKLGASEDLCIGAALSSLMRCSTTLSRKCAQDEANGEMGYVDLVLPEPMKDHEIDLLSWRLQSEAISAATRACESLCQLESLGSARIVAAHSSILKCLFNFASCTGFCDGPAYKGGLKHSQHPFAICARNSLRRAERSAMSILLHLANSPDQCISLLPFKYEILEAAFSNTAHSPQMLRILMMIEEGCSARNDTKES